MIIDAAQAADQDALRVFHGRTGIPRIAATTLVARRNGDIVGWAGLERYDDQTLLCAVSVDETVRGLGVGQRLTHAALDWACERNIEDVFLVTTTPRFFMRFGFEPVTHDDAPAAMRESLRLTPKCPPTMEILRLKLVPA